MTTNYSDYNEAIAPASHRTNLARCAVRILLESPLSVAEQEHLVTSLEVEACPRRFREQLAEYLWEHHIEELVVAGRDELDLALQRIDVAFAMLDEGERCGSTPPLLWLDVRGQRRWRIGR